MSSLNSVPPKTNSRIKRAGKIAKNIALFTIGTVLTASIAAVAYSYKADRDMKKTLSRYDPEKVQDVLANQSHDEVAAVHALKNMGSFAALLYQSHPDIANRLGDKNKTPDGKTVVTKDGNDFVVWLTGDKREVKLKNILSERDPDTRALVCAVVDEETNEVFITLGGTNPLDFELGKKPDLLNAGVPFLASMVKSDAISERAPMGADFVEKIATNLQKDYPKISLDKWKLAVFTHSLGAEAGAALKYAAAGLGMNVNVVFNFAPWNAENGFNNVARTTGIPAKLLLQNVYSITDQKPALNGEGICTPVGKVIHTDSKGHNAHNFISAKPIQN